MRPNWRGPAAAGVSDPSTAFRSLLEGEGATDCSTEACAGPLRALLLVLVDPTLTALRLTGPQISVKFGLSTETVDISQAQPSMSGDTRGSCGAPGLHL